MKSTKPQYKLADLITGLDVTLKGDPDCVITGVGTIQNSETGQITFLTNPLYRKHLANTQASAVILSEADAEHCGVNAIISRNPYYVYAKIAGYFDEVIQDKKTGIHPKAVIGEYTQIDPAAIISANCVIGNHVIIGAHAVIGEGTVIGDYAVIDESARLDANVTIYHHVKIGKRSYISSGAVIGSDGFGFANQKGVWHKVPQLGSVIIGDDVDIGANTTIDRGALEDTVIGNGVKLDNQIQIGHNVVIGENTIIAGCTGIAGSTTIGKNCMIGGRANIIGHITICDNVVITATTGVRKSITEPGMYSAGIGAGAVPSKEFKKTHARFSRFEKLYERVQVIETLLKEKEKEKK